MGGASVRNMAAVAWAAIAVMVATLLTKQHYLLDEFAGACLAACIAAAVIRIS